MYTYGPSSGTMLDFSGFTLVKYVVSQEVRGYSNLLCNPEARVPHNFLELPWARRAMLNNVL